MRRDVYNKNEKRDRNRQLYNDRKNGMLVKDISEKYDVSLPRVHRIIMQEDNKSLQKENERLREELAELKGESINE